MIKLVCKMYKLFKAQITCIKVFTNFMLLHTIFPVAA